MLKKKIDLYVLTGFLGSGKTTLLLKILDLLRDQKIGIVQNEFGKLGIDGMILKKDNIEMIEINRGSIFCSCLKLSFAQALSELTKYDINCVFVESSGLADPSNIEEILGGVKILVGDIYELKGVICLIDAVNFTNQLKDLETVNRQLKHCNLAVINKVDLINDEELQILIEEIRKINPICEIDTCSFGNLSKSFIEKNLLEKQWAENEETTNSIENKPKTLTLKFDKTVTKLKLIEFLDYIKNDTYRIKGFFKLENGWYQIDVVGEIIDFKPCEEKDCSTLVFISKIGPKIIKPLINTWNNIIGEKMDLKN